MDLDQLIKEFQQKDVKAFEALYDMYCDSMLGVINNILRDEEISQEVLQDVFMKAWNNSESYSAKKGRFFTWILNIARNAAIDKTRSKSYKKNIGNIDLQSFADLIPSNENLDDKTDAIGIAKYVNALADKCKQVIELIYFMGYTQKETSESLDIPIGTVKTRNRSCIDQLRSALEIQI